LHYAQQAQAAAGAHKPPDGHLLSNAPPVPATFAAVVELGKAQAATAATATTAAAAAAAVAARQPFPTTDQPLQANNFHACFHHLLVVLSY
jgi:hypothetical protein